MLADKHQRFLQIDTITLGVARHAQSTQNNKFTISLQYLKKNVSDEADLLHAYKHERFLQIDIMIFDMVKHSQSSKNIKFVMSL